MVTNISAYDSHSMNQKFKKCKLNERDIKKNDNKAIFTGQSLHQSPIATFQKKGTFYLKWSLFTHAFFVLALPIFFL